MWNDAYTHIGKKFKFLALLFYKIEVIVSVLVGVVGTAILIDRSYGDLWWIIFVAPFAILFSIVGSWICNSLLYALGELVENSTLLREKIVDNKNNGNNYYNAGGFGNNPFISRKSADSNNTGMSTNYNVPEI